MTTFYLHLYNDRKGLNPRLDDRDFLGPVIGPITGFFWKRGFLMLDYAGKEFHLETTEYGDHVRYGGALYNSMKIMTGQEVENIHFTFCARPIEIHTIDIFSQLINQ